MRFVTSTLVWSTLFAPAVLAIPSSRYGARAVHRRGGKQSQLNNRVEQCTSDVSDATTYSSNWAGAVWDQDNVRRQSHQPCLAWSHPILFSQGTFTSVTGTFTVPTPSGENGTAASVWVGIDGDTCTSAILQTGIDFTLNNGEASYDGKGTLGRVSKRLLTNVSPVHSLV